MVFSADEALGRHKSAKDLPVSPVPLFLIATAALAAFALFLIIGMLRAPLKARVPIALRQRRVEKRIRWDRLHASGTEPGA